MKIKTNDIESIRHINTIMVLNELRNADHLLSRPNIADNLGLSKVTISHIARDLNRKKLTVDAGFGVPDSRGGRRPLLLDLDRNSLRVVGVCFDPSGVTMSLCDITGREICRSSGLPQGQDYVSLTASMLKELLASAGVAKEAIIGLVALVGGKSEEAIGKDGLGGPGTHLAGQLRDALDVPVRTASFTRARAFVESWHQTKVAQQRTSFFYLDLDLELDCVAVRRSLLDHLTCEFGACHMTALAYGEDGQCVTVDSLLSGQALLHKARKLLKRELNLTQLKALAVAGDEKILELMREYGHWLGCSLALVVNMASLRTIVLGGSISELWPFFEATMWTGVESHVSANVTSTIKVQVIEEEFASGMAGAVALALDWWIFRTDRLYDAVPSETFLE